MADKPFLQSLFEAPEEKVFVPKQPDAPKATETSDIEPVRRSAPTKADIVARAKELDVDPKLALSFFSAESSGNFNSKDSPKGAQGGFQVMPATFRQMRGPNADPKDPWENMEAGLSYMAHGQKVLGTKDPELIAAGYHAGYGRKELKEGRVPDTHDGLMSTKDYAKKVAGGAGKASTDNESSRYREPTAEELKQYEAGLAGGTDSDTSGRYRDPTPEELATLETGQAKQKETDEQGFFDRAGTAVSRGYDNTLQSLETAKFAITGGDTDTLSKSLAKKFAAEQARQKTTGEQEIDAAFKEVTDAKGAWDTVKKGASAIGTAITNPKDLAVGIAEQAPNMLPTLAGGVVGAGGGAVTGGAIGAGVGAVGGGVGAIPGAAGGAVTGAIWGGRAGMAAGTTVTEVGAEVESMILKRLEEKKTPPTEQNIKALLDDKTFQKEALDQGLKKGLTVAAIDQLFLGLGGKIATAPTRKVAISELASQGIDISTKKAVKTALASEAGKEALKAAKPAVRARVAAGATAIGVDAVGETTGEATSQLVARGEVDAGDALREGVYGFGQSIVEPAIGAGMQVAKQAYTPAPPAAPSGPLTSSVEKVAETKGADETRVTVTSPEGEVSGQIKAYQEDEQGGFVAQIEGDDGQTYQFSSADGVQITPTDTPSGPLASSVEKVAEQEGAALQQAPATEAPVEQAAAPAPIAAKPKRKPAPKPKATTEDAPQLDLAPQTDDSNLADMDEPALRTRLKYIADQAKASGGWNKMFVEERNRIEKAIAQVKKAPKVEATTETKSAFTDRAEANSAMLKAAETTGAMHEVVEADGKFTIQPLKESTDGRVDSAAVGLGDGTTQGTQNVAQDGSDQSGGRSADQKPVAIADTLPGAPVSSTGPAVSSTGATTDGQPALKDVAAGKWFGSQEKAIAFVGKKKLDASHEVVQTGKVRFEIKPKAATQVDAAASEAATSPDNNLPEPTDAQKEAGNYKKGHTNLHGMDIAIENPRGSTRSGKRKDGSTWSHEMSDHYGYVKRTMGADGDQVDVYIGPKQESQNVYVVDQVNQDSGKFDEHKAMIGFDSEQEAVAAYESNFDKGWKVGPVKAMSVDGFKSWLKDGDTSKPAVTASTDKYAQIDAGFAQNRAALANFKVGQDVEFTNPGTYTQADGSKREGLVVRGKFEKVLDKDQGTVKVGNYNVAARNLRAATPDTSDKAEQPKAVTVTKSPGVTTIVIDPSAMRDKGPTTDPTPPANKAKPDPFAGNKLFTTDRVEAARARMKSKLGQLNSGIDPELMIDGMTIAGAYIESGVRDFSAYAKAMTDDLGEAIKPYLLSFYEGARNYPGLKTEGMSSAEDAKAAHAILMKSADTTEVAEVLGEKVAKPSKRTKKTGAKGDMTLTQDWGVEHIDGYSDDYNRETGSSVKDAFLKEAKAYLTTVAALMAEQGYTPHIDKKGRPDRPVSVNEAGTAVSGEVSLTLDHADTGKGIYVQIGGSSLRGVVPNTQSGVAILFRAASADDKYGAKGQNRWAPVDLSASDFAQMLDNTAKQSQVAKSVASPTMNVKEVQQNDTQPTQQDTGTRAEGQAAEPARTDEGGRDAQRVPEPTGSDSADADSGRARPTGERQAVPGDKRSTDEGAGSERAPKSSRGSRTTSGDRGTGKPASLNYRIKPGEIKREGSWRATAERNVAIVELVKKIEAEGRKATPEELAQMTKFTGWGASEIANGIFPDQYGRYKNADWQGLGERLKASLTPEEFDQARRSTQYAHYTSESVIRSIYSGLDRLGFKGGTVVEPGMGIGLFNGLMPDHMASNTQYTGIEYDGLTGAIAKALYPASNVIVGDYTRTALPKDFFDAAIGNPPFSASQVLNDPEYKARRPMLHDYFFMKTIDRVKPGGLLVFVTSKGTMDKTSDKSRKYLAERGNLLGAIRLPQTAFKDNAGTEVVTDVIFLQKRGDGIPDNGVKWLDTKSVETPQGPTSINEYFADNPNMVLGTNALTGSMYRKDEYTVLPLEGDIEQHFADAVKNLPENVTRPVRGSLAERAVVQDRDFNPTHKKEGGLYVNGSKLMQVEDGSGVELEHRAGAEGKKIALKPKEKAWLKGYVGVRDALKQAQFDQLNDGDWEKSLKALNKAYDSFVKEHGPILDYTTITRETDEGPVETKRLKNAPLFQSDVEGALVYALEAIKEDGSIVKGVALKERVLERTREPEIKTTNDAMFVSLNRHGTLNLDDVAALAGTDRATVIRDLGTAIYDAPGKGYQLADEYLSGNVVKKLAEAQAASEVDGKYKRNVEALLAVQPRPLGPTEITVRLGANWVPASDIEAFAEGAMGDNMNVTYSPITGQWNVDQRSYGASEWSFNKMSAGDILSSVLNSRQIKVTFRDQDNKTHTDLEATEKANDIAGKMRDRFRTWLWTDAGRADRLVKHYNQHFNNIAPRSFDGSHLTLPGVSSRYTLHPHQKRAVWRVIQQGDVYLAHAVGAGKTMEMIASGMEERRLGLVNKPMYVVPNHMLAQFAREFLELYPAANIMVADEHNFHTHNRKRFVAQAALNNPDAIVITHSAFGRIGMSDEYSAKFINDQIASWKEALDDVDSGDRITVKQIERRIEQLERRLEGKQGKDKKDQVLSFEELGVDKLYVDEFHEFRKLDFATNQGAVKGIDSNGSQRSLDLFMKAEHLRAKKPGRAMVAASGTPVTNTMGELFTAQRFFQPEQLKEDGLDTFDAWSAQYGDIVTGFEQNAAGGYEMVARFAKFQNVPELMRRVRSFMDILTSSNLGALVTRPDVTDGGRQVIVTPVPDGYKEYQQELQRRIKTIRDRKGPPKKGDDIILNVIADGRFSAIDMRFVDNSLPSDPNSKLNVWVDDIINDYKQTSALSYTDKDGKPEPLKGASVIGFTDIGLGDAAATNRGFDMRKWIEKRFADAGIPSEQVAFMRDYKQHSKKERMFADMRAGKKRILIGGKEMETGVNVQKRLASLRHLDAPWFPASVEQREGRIIRQGNQNAQVGISAYATKGSYDSTMWGMNARKARFIEQAMNGDDNVRSLDDVSEASAFEMASALASGDERYLKLAGLKTDVERFERLRHAHYSDQNSLRRDKHSAEDLISRNEARTNELTKAIEKRVPIMAGSFTGKVGAKSYDNREEFSLALFEAFKELGDAETLKDTQIGEIGGFPITFYSSKLKSSYMAGAHVGIPGDPDPILNFPIDPEQSVSGVATRAANQINSLDRELTIAKGRVDEGKRKVASIKGRLGAPFPEEQILLERVAELNALQEELSKETEETVSPDAAAASVEGESDSEPKYSVAPLPDDATMLQRIADAKELFHLPASEETTIDGIAADNDPRITVKKVTSIPGEIRYNLTMADGSTARIIERPHSNYGPALYGYDMVDGEMKAITAGRPGKNGDYLDGKDDVWLDVSLLDKGTGNGAMIYNIASTYAHNTGKVFIGDPAGLSNEALQRRPELMLSSALKFGTTDHLAPHPRQVQGDPEIGVPPLDWVYGDHAGNIEKLAKVNLANIDNAGGNGGISYNQEKNIFEDEDGNPITRADIGSLAELGLGREAQAGGRTLARNVLIRSLLQGEGGSARGGRQGNGLLGSFFQLLSDHDSNDMGSPIRDILYSVRSVSNPSTAREAESAIRSLMTAKGGEQVVTHPELGDIAIPYGDTNAGLQHIVSRRGQPFLDRIPALIASGKVYTKPGQTGRVFLGNERDEAALRLDWNGESKTWLATAYEKYPDLKAATGQMSSREKAPNRTDRPLSVPELRKTVGSGVFGQVVQQMIDDGLIVLHANRKTLPDGLGKGVKGQIQAVTAPDRKIHMVANSLYADNARGVLLHEAFHEGVEKLIGSTEWSKLLGRGASLYRQSEQSTGKAREFFDKARSRVASAKAQGAVSTKMEVEEFLAYAIEEYANAPASIRQWVDDFLGYIKAWLVRSYGKQFGQVTPAQLKALAQLALMTPAVDRRFGSNAAKFSVAPDAADKVRPAPKGKDKAAQPAAVKAAEETGFTPPEQGTLRNLQSALQDDKNRLKQVQDRIMKMTGRTELGAADHYRAETNRPGRIAARLEDAEKKLTGPLMVKLAKSGHTQTQLEDLMHAMHAQERNKRAGILHPEDSDFFKAMEDGTIVGASGMSSDKANEILGQYRGNKELHALAEQARDIAKATLDLKHSYGLIDDETHETLTKAYAYYVPLKGDGEFGPKIKRAMGHEEREEHILENIARDYDQAVMVGEKNLARQSLLRLVLEFADEDLWTARVPPKGRYVAGQVFNIVHNGETVGSFNSRSQVSAFLEAKGAQAVNYEVLESNGDRVQSFVKPLQNNEVMVYVKGEPIRLQIKDEKLAAQLRPLNQGQMHPVLEFMRGMNRYLSKIYTGYNPAFILRNAARDAMTGTINILGREGATVAAKAWAGYPAALGAMGQFAATGKPPEGKTGKYLTEYRMHGGKTGASWMSDLEQQGKKLQTMFDDAYGATSYMADGKPGKAAIVAGRKLVGGMAHVVEIANQATENALRLSLYVTLREQGETPGIAAQAAKAVTVDFDRKGTATGVMGAIYLFFNPAVQGAANGIKTLAQGKHKQQAYVALATLGMLGFYAASQGMDEDEDRWLGEGWDTRTKNLMFNVGGHQIRVPLSQEFAPVYALGVALAESTRGVSAKKSAVNVVSSFIDAYFPLQGAYSPESDNKQLDMAMAVVPTIIKPQVQSAVNRNNFGSEIVPESEFTADRPDNLKMTRGTKNSAYDKAAQGIASVGEMLGAGKYENDITKVSPETLKLMWRNYTGGLGTFVADSIGVASMTASDPSQVNASDIPIVKDFWRNSDVKPIRGRYYDLSRDARQAITEFEQAKKAGDGVAMDKILNDPDKERLIGLGRLVRNTNKAVSAVRDGEVDINADVNLTPAEKRSALKDIEKDEEALYRDAISAFK